MMCSFWSYTAMISEILGHLNVFFKISDGTTGFLDENWLSIVKKIKKSEYDLQLLILLTIDIYIYFPGLRLIARFSSKTC